jgi:hypothetical protein
MPRHALGLPSRKALASAESRRSGRTRACERCRGEHRACNTEKPCINCRLLGVVCQEALCCPRRPNEPAYLNLDVPLLAPNPTLVPSATCPAPCFFEFVVKRGTQQPTSSAIARKRSIPMMRSPRQHKHKVVHPWSSSFKLEARQPALPIFDGQSLQQSPQQHQQLQQHRVQQPVYAHVWPALPPCPLQAQSPGANTSFRCITFSQQGGWELDALADERELPETGSVASMPQAKKLRIGGIAVNELLS